ncbi:unnamed protein product [Adineta steineri]|uniref:Uncharacterized protein n=1 Tax=Adineta steineri TaxID=433720 RepID=A0A814WNV6_9BILA|nr:unnamed protein product [Adineta steineri]CAF3755950.1 unnamed protein product [Adineta steineri]
MPISDYDFTFKFFRPPQRTVPFHNGLLDIRTKHTKAQDRLVVAEQRLVDVERRKSSTHLQSLAYEQKRIEKKLALLHNNINSTYSDQPLKMRNRSSSEVILPKIRPSKSMNEPLSIHLSKLSMSLQDSKQNLLSLPKIIDPGRRLSAYSDGDVSESSFFTSDMDSGEDGETEDNKNLKSHLQTIASKRLSIKRDKLLLRKPIKPLPPIVAIIPPEEDFL